MYGQIFFLIVIGLLLAVANGNTSIPTVDEWLNPPIIAVLAAILIANLVEYGPKLWQRITNRIKGTRLH